VTTAPESPPRDKSLRPNSGLESELSNPHSQPRPSHRPESLASASRPGESDRRQKSLAQLWVDICAIRLDGKPGTKLQARVSEPHGPESPPWMLQPMHFVETLSTITTFAKHPTKLLSPKPNTGLQTPIFSSFLGAHPRDTGST
jgi:hypothetical protein